jgi:glycosyltransferase involved in cell wall biosynthesis
MAGVHVVQLGYDQKVFDRTPASESLDRQIGYANLLAGRTGADARLSFVVITSRADAVAFRERNLTVLPFTHNRHGLNKLTAWYRLHKLLAALHRERPVDVITSQTVYDEGWVAARFARRVGIPIVGQIHFDLFSPSARLQLQRSALGRVRYAAMLRGLKGFTAIRTVGTGTAREIEARRLHRRVYTIPVASDLARVQADVGRPRQDTVLYAGRFAWEKDLHRWLEVARLVAARQTTCRFELAGSGPLEGQLRELADSLGLAERVTFSGFLDRAALRHRYRSAAVFLLTSRYEGYGRVVAEALANGLPVVAPRIAGVDDLVRNDETGFLHEQTDAAGMANSVLKLLADPSLARRMGAAGQEFIRNHQHPDTLRAAWVDLLVSTAACSSHRVQ